MHLTERLLAFIRTLPDGEPVAIGEVARELDCSEAEIVSAATDLETRKFGDSDIVSVVTRERPGGAKETFLSRFPAPLNEEPGH